MRNSISGCLTLVALAAGSLAALGQVSAQLPSNAAPARHAQPVQLAYTAEFKVTHVQTLADGNTITHETTEVMARDSQGRHVHISTQTPMVEDQTVRTSVNVNDPVAHTHSFWMVPGQRVTVTNFPDPMAAGNSCAGSVPVPSTHAETVQRTKPTVEDLGVQTFQGVEAHGRRTTYVTPAGAIGNTDPMVHTNEVWFSSTPGLAGINLREVTEDPRMGRTTRDLTRFTQGEPDASLFQAPQDYEVVTQETHEEVRCPQ